MEFNEKLQELRNRRGLTQEELAEKLYVSRTAVSKWESARGYPSLDSLRELSRFFGVSIDELLSGEELLTAAQEDSRQKVQRMRDLIFGLSDCSGILLYFLPIFGQRTDSGIRSVTLPLLLGVSDNIKLASLLLVAALCVWGVLLLALQSCAAPFWAGWKYRISLVLGAAGVLLFMATLQPYAAAFVFFFLAVKALLLIKWT